MTCGDASTRQASAEITDGRSKGRNLANPDCHADSFGRTVHINVHQQGTPNLYKCPERCLSSCQSIASLLPATCDSYQNHARGHTSDPSESRAPIPHRRPLKARDLPTAPPLAARRVPGGYTSSLANTN